MRARILLTLQAMDKLRFFFAGKWTNCVGTNNFPGLESKNETTLNLVRSPYNTVVMCLPLSVLPVVKSLQLRIDNSWVVMFLQ